MWGISRSGEWEVVTSLSQQSGSQNDPWFSSNIPPSDNLRNIKIVIHDMLSMLRCTDITSTNHNYDKGSGKKNSMILKQELRDLCKGCRVSSFWILYFILFYLIFISVFLLNNVVLLYIMNCGVRTNRKCKYQHVSIFCSVFHRPLDNLVRSVSYAWTIS